MNGRRIEPARIVWRADDLPEAATFGDVYFSRDGGLAESEYVFLRHNDLPARFRRAETFTIVETGFGTGLNCLLTVQRWLETAPATARLHFISFEKHPLTLSDLRRAHAGWPTLAPQAAALQSGYPPLLPGWHRIALHPRADLWLWFGDVHEGLAQLDVRADAWFLDGFAPARNPEMWTPALFERMAALSAPGATFATFTAAGVVRRGLAAAGFTVERVPGFGRKREMCRGVLSGTAWQPVGRPTSRRIAVIGAGLAGAAVARRLADDGHAVTVLEAQQPASGASGNRAGVLHPVLTADWSLRSQWYWLALQTTWPWWQRALRAGVPGALDGLWHRLPNATWVQRITKLRQRFHTAGLFDTVAAPACSGSGEDTVLLTRWGGWLSPVRLVAWLLAHENITQRQQHVRQVQATPEAVQVDGEGFDTVIWAGGTGQVTTAPWPRDWIRPVKGQVSWLEGARLPGLTPGGRPLLHGGYTVPLADGIVTGATFEKRALTDLSPSQDGRCHNVALLVAACPRWQPEAACLQTTAGDRVSLRPTTRDHTPIGGWLIDHRLGVSLGHGARGLVSVMMVADWLARDLQEKGRSGPVFPALARLSAPARFFKHDERQAS